MHLFYSKLALLELGGWIEISLDEIFYREVKFRMSNTSYIKEMKGSIKKNSGFAYEFNIRKVLIQLIGHHGIELLESNMNAATFIRFKAELISLRNSRNSEAHVYIKGTTRSIDAPSITRARIEPLHAGLLELRDKVRQI